MAGVKKLDSDELLRFKDGSVVDESLFENEPLESTFHEVEAIPEKKMKAMFESLFPDRSYPSDEESK